MQSMFYLASAFNQDITGWCVTNIVSEPSEFSPNSPLSESNKPVWGTCTLTAITDANIQTAVDLWVSDPICSNNYLWRYFRLGCKSGN